MPRSLDRRAPPCQPPKCGGRRPPTSARHRSRPVSSIALLDSALPAQELRKLLDRNARLADQCPQRTLRDFAVIRDREPAKRRLAMSQDDVTALLTVDLVPEPAERGYGRSPGYPRQQTHTATSITSSWMEGGIGSPRSRRLSRYPSIASRTFESAAERVAPCDTQPGRDGTVATNTPSSSASITIRNFTGRSSRKPAPWYRRPTRMPSRASPPLLPRAAQRLGAQLHAAREPRCYCGGRPPHLLPTGRPPARSLRTPRCGGVSAAAPCWAACAL